MKVLMLSGIPASGKSTKAKELCKDTTWKRVNKDDIRSSLGNGYVYSKATEDVIKDTEFKLAIKYLSEGFNVVVDDTNATPNHRKTWEDIATKAGAEFEVLRFDTPLNECLSRNALREDPVPEKFIKDMYRRWFATNLYDERYQVIQDDSLIHCIIVDLDGTLALRNGRNPYDFDKVDTDLVNKPILNLLNTINKDTFVILMSGRDESCRLKTKNFLLDNNVYYDALYMRADKDSRPDEVVKLELYNNHIKGQYHVDFVLDDRDKVVKMWREQGLTCLQVYYGDF